MRVTFVVPGGVDPPGGERVIPFVHQLIASTAANHEVTVVAVGHDREAGEWELFGAPVVNVPIGRHGKADIARVLATVPKAAARRGRPDVVHGLWANLPGLAAMVAARRWRAPSVVTVCGGELAAVPAIDYGGGLRSGTRRLALAALKGATATTVATEWMHRHVVGAGAPSPEVLPLGADATAFSPGGIATDPFRLVHIAGLNRVKDQDLLLQAFAAAVVEEPRLTLTIAGGDTLHGHHAALAAGLGVADRVTFLGHVAHGRLADVCRGAGLHVLTSHHDAGPIAVLEAALCGVPTVGTSVGHVADMATMDPAGAHVVEGRDPAALASAIVHLVRERDERDALAAVCQRWAAQHDAAFTATAFEQLYRRLAG